MKVQRMRILDMFFVLLCAVKVEVEVQELSVVDVFPGLALCRHVRG